MDTNDMVLSMSSKSKRESRDKRTHVWAKAERTCVLLATGVLSLSSKSRDKRTYVWAKAKQTCVLLDIGEQEREIQNAQVNFIKVRCSARFYTPHKIHPLSYSTPPAIFYTPWLISLQLLYYEISEAQQL